MPLQHLLRLMYEHLRLPRSASLTPCFRLASRTPCAEEELRLGRDDADEGCEGGDAGCGPEEGAPVGGDGGDEEEVDDSGDGTVLVPYMNNFIFPSSFTARRSRISSSESQSGLKKYKSQ